MITLYNNLPTVDLHGEDRFNAVLITKEFINDNIKLHQHKIMIIHGRGTDTLRKAIHAYLKSNPNVLKYQRDFFNMGCTIIDLK